MKFIIADDSVRQRDMLVRILRDEGHEVLLAANDAREALVACDKEQGNVDVVILDVSMRFIQGDEAGRQIVSKYPTQKVIVVSNLSQGAVSRSLLDDGIGFIAKPYNTGQFLNRMYESIKALDAEHKKLEV